MNVWYWATLCGLVLAVPITLIFVEGSLLMLSLTSTLFYVGYDWWKHSSHGYPEGYSDTSKLGLR